MARAVDGGHAESFFHRNAVSDGAPNGIVDVSLGTHVVGGRVVRTQAEHGTVLRRDDRCQGSDALSCRAFAHENRHAAADALQRFFSCTAFVVAGDSGGDVGGKTVTLEHRSMTVDVLMCNMRHRQLFQHSAVAGQHGRHVHDFG